MSDDDDLPQSVEDGWVQIVGETMPTAEEINRDPMGCLRAFFYAGATCGVGLVYSHGIMNVREELREWHESVDRKAS